MVQFHQVTAKTEPSELSTVMDPRTIERQISALERQKADIEKAIMDLEAARKRNNTRE